MNNQNNVVINTTEENEVFVESTHITLADFDSNNHEETYNEDYMENIKDSSATQGLL